jgi:hypothetical protein
LTTRTHYTAAEVLALWGGNRILESPLIKEILAECTQDSILTALTARFGEVPLDVIRRLRRIRAATRLKDFLRHAIRCPDLEAFRARLLS